MRDETHFDALITRRFDEGGSVLSAAKIDDQPGATQTLRDPPLIRNRFMKGLGTSRGGRAGRLTILPFAITRSRHRKQDT